jgi:hypothetical protein
MPNHEASGLVSDDDARLIAILKAVQNAFAGTHPEPSHVGTIMQLYGVSLRLGTATDRLGDTLGAGGSPAAARGGTAERREATLRAWFALVRDFAAALADTNLAAIDVYYPGLAEELIGSVGQDLDVWSYLEVYLAPQYDIDLDEPPAVLQLFLEDFNGDSGPNREWARRVEDEVLPSRRVLTEAPAYLQGHARDRLRRLGEALEQCRDLLASVLHENWTFREVLGDVPRDSPTVELTIGDRFQDIRNSTIINRSVLDRSVASVTQTDGSDAAELLEQVASLVEGYGDADAVETFESFCEELQRPNRRKAVLRSLWAGLVAGVPTLSAAVDVATKVAALLR